MKYAITGHTGGIGFSLGEKINDLGFSYEGFSRANGYDINIKKDRQRIIEESSDCNIFINNAQNGYGQVDMLVDLYHAWKNTNKTIINIGSEIAEDHMILKGGYDHLLEYQVVKKALKVLHNDIQKLEAGINMKYVYFGYVGTDRILKKYPNLPKNQYITVEEAVRQILA